LALGRPSHGRDASQGEEARGKFGGQTNADDMEEDAELSRFST